MPLCLYNQRQMGDRLAEKIKKLHDVSEIDVIVPVRVCPSLTHSCLVAGEPSCLPACLLEVGESKAERPMI
jgi:hypothetical protein